ncbi:ChaN family lipoprotein [uncultured Pseudodesulfovibrio sp.]|uniref:ChaN family lipoprotein n=1 Tax=uncultured Pseudodesulfovibrio sp. TaxID=2035858 RepID=UPI0029C98D74|nr:ChaN family lipoprotein [uncultured Pseudodesulfovibrio sp.]
MKNCNNYLFPVRRWAVLLLLCVATSMGACVKKTVHPQLDVTFLPQKGDFISKYGDRLPFSEIIRMSKGKDYILVGEGHKNAVDHNVQQRLLDVFSKAEKPPAVGLEMVAVDMQPVLDDFGKGLVEVAELEEELQWNTKWGYSFSFFERLFEIANRNSLPVAGLNVPTRITKKISKEGLDALSEDEREFLPMEIVPPSNAQVPLLDLIFEQHEAKDADDATQRERFHLVQSIWDSKMAEEAVRLRKKYDWPVFIVAGSGHVESGWGIARRIRRFDPAAKILTLMPWRGGEFDGDLADAFFYSPDSYMSKMGALLTATGSGGLLVESVERESRAAKAGLRPGDMLLEASGIQLDYLFSLHMAGSKVYKANEELVFTVRRGGETFSANVGKLGARKPKKEVDPEAQKDVEKSGPEAGSISENGEDR